MSALSFELGSSGTSKGDGRARTGLVTTGHGAFETPAFMPVGTYGAVRGLTPAQLADTGAAIVLANAYHLSLRPGVETIGELGGIHRFMSWPGPILTDSGGFQLFSLSAELEVNEQGAVARSELDGQRMEITPESALVAQQVLGVDIAMAFDVFTGRPGDRDEAAATSARTLRWAVRTKVERDKGEHPATAVFGIMQGGLFEDLRRENASELATMGFDGHAVGGLSVGEDRDDTMAAAETSVAFLPEDRPRYMMGMGAPSDLVRLAGWGYDMFDCVMPTRGGRNGLLFTSRGNLSIRNARHARSPLPVDESCGCYCCANFSRGYLHHLSKRKEMLGASLASYHNLSFYGRLMRQIRQAIAAGRYEEFRREFLSSQEGEN